MTESHCWNSRCLHCFQVQWRSTFRPSHWSELVASKWLDDKWPDNDQQPYFIAMMSLIAHVNTSFVSEWLSDSRVVPRGTNSMPSVPSFCKSPSQPVSASSARVLRTSSLVPCHFWELEIENKWGCTFKIAFTCFFSSFALLHSCLLSHYSRDRDTVSRGWRATHWISNWSQNCSMNATWNTPVSHSRHWELQKMRGGGAEKKGTEEQDRALGFLTSRPQASSSSWLWSELLAAFFVPEFHGILKLIGSSWYLGKVAALSRS